MTFSLIGEDMLYYIDKGDKIVPIYDTTCVNCGNTIEQFLGMNEEPIMCVRCGGIMTKGVGGYFRLVSNNKTQLCGWASDGYASNQYWSAVRKQRSEGKDVKACDEN
jgi:hypothetical protein